MFGDISYKVSFTFALILHLVLAIFLLVKFKHSQPLGLVPGHIINATAISYDAFMQQMNKTTVNKTPTPKQKQKKKKTLAKTPKRRTATKKTVTKRSTKKQLQTILKKNLSQERTRELAELKKERQEHKKTAAKLKEQKLQKILHEQIAAEQKLLSDISDGKASGALLQGEVDKHKALVKYAIDSQWIKPEGVVPGDFCELLVDVAPGGVVLNIKLVRSSGNLVLDRSAQAAVLKASPLPVPEDPKLFDRFRALRPIFKPEGMVGN